MDQYESHWVQDEYTGDKGFLDEREDLFWVYDEDQCFLMKLPSKEDHCEKVVGQKEKGSQASRKEERINGSPFFPAVPERGGKGKKSGKGGSSSASKANVAEEEVEEEEAEDDALLSDKKKRQRKPQAKKNHNLLDHQHEAAVDEDGFSYSAISFPCDMVSSNNEWCLKGAKVETFYGSHSSKIIKIASFEKWKRDSHV